LSCCRIDCSSSGATRLVCLRNSAGRAAAAPKIDEISDDRRRRCDGVGVLGPLGSARDGEACGEDRLGNKASVSLRRSSAEREGEREGVPPRGVREGVDETDRSLLLRSNLGGEALSPTAADGTRSAAVGPALGGDADEAMLEDMRAALPCCRYELLPADTASGFEVRSSCSEDECIVPRNALRTAAFVPDAGPSIGRNNGANRFCGLPVGAETLSALFSSCKQVCCTTTCHVAWCMFFGGSYRAASTRQVPSALAVPRYSKRGCHICAGTARYARALVRYRGLTRRV